MLATYKSKIWEQYETRLKDEPTEKILISIIDSQARECDNIQEELNERSQDFIDLIGNDWEDYVTVLHDASIDGMIMNLDGLEKIEDVLKFLTGYNTDVYKDTSGSYLIIAE